MPNYDSSLPPPRGTEFDYKRAWHELVRPELSTLPHDVYTVYYQVVALSGEQINQIDANRCEFPATAEGSLLKQKLQPAVALVRRRAAGQS